MNAPTLDAETVATLPQPGVDVHFGVPLGKVRDVWDTVVQEMKGTSVRLGVAVTLRLMHAESFWEFCELLRNGST